MKETVTLDECTIKPRTAAERQAAYRARKGRQIVLHLPDDVHAALLEKLREHQANKAPDATLSSYLERIIRQQVLRKR